MKKSTDEVATRNAKVFVLLLFALAIELVFFKFLPDLGTAVLPAQGPSPFSSFKAFQDAFSTPGTVAYPRFAGPAILTALAKLLGGHMHSNDMRLHPLRIAAGILTPLYALLGLLPVLLRPTRFRWDVFAALYCSYNVLALYAFYPYDMPSIALISVAAYLILEDSMGPALLVLLLTGLFRESALHIVWFVFAWAVCNRGLPLIRRVAWLLAFTIAFVAEYFMIRRIYPGHGSTTLNLHEIFLGRGLWSLTCIVTLGVIVIVPLFYLSRPGEWKVQGWRHTFFVLNCAATPAWIIFYRIMGGNISELRMLIPILLPIFYGIAMAPNLDRALRSEPAR